MILNIEKLIYGGAGFGEADGKKIFVNFTAPGDTVEVKIVRDKGKFAEAELVNIIDPSPYRALPTCPVFGKCGGCQWQHLTYDTQLIWKKKILQETLERIGGIKDFKIFDILPSPKQWNYRNRIQLHVDKKGRIGFYRPRTNEIVEFERCYIADEKLNKMLTRDRTEIAKRNRGISLRLSEGPHFSQVNVEQNENVRELLMKWIDEIPNKTIVELYAGSGNFTFAMAKRASRIIALEIDGRAIRHAQELAAQKKMTNVEFHCRPSEKIQDVYKGPCDILFINPPRKGAAEALDAIIDLRPETIFYMSCNPSTLARDVKKLETTGWKLKKCQPIDMFPQTFHIESLLMLSRSKQK